jgi:hypothetical protein
MSTTIEPRAPTMEWNGTILSEKGKAYVDVQVTCKGAIKYFLSVPDEDARHLKEDTNLRYVHLLFTQLYS